MKQLIPISILLLVICSFLSNVATAGGNKDKNSTKKADVKKVAREEHRIVLNWANLHKKNAEKKKKIKRQFES